MEQPEKTEIEIKLEERAKKERAEKAAKEQAFIDSCIPIPPKLDVVEKWVPAVDADGKAIMEPAGPSDAEDTQMVTLAVYTSAINMLSSEAPNAHAVTNIEFTKVVDLLRHSIGCLEAIATTKMDGTVSERLEQCKKIAMNTATNIKNTLGVKEDG